MNETISIPTPEKIKVAAAEIQQTWSESERQTRDRQAKVRQRELFKLLFPADSNSLDTA